MLKEIGTRFVLTSISISIVVWLLVGRVVVGWIVDNQSLGTWLYIIGFLAVPFVVGLIILGAIRLMRAISDN